MGVESKEKSESPIEKGGSSAVGEEKHAVCEMT